MAYILFGALHELAHVLAAHLFSSSTQPRSIFSYDAILSVLLERRVVLNIKSDDNEEFYIRNTGWIFSLLLALMVCHRYGKASPLGMAAIVTAIEAIATDLFELGQFLPLSTSIESTVESSVSATKCIFYCGNFGILLLNHWWWTNKRGRESALDCLEQMVYTTMMRGAQSGGVVNYTPYGKTPDNMKAIRTRVLNRKRTDLSKQIRQQVEKSFSPDKGSDAVLLSGHTRFATSSKATLDGTHPHRWCDGSWKRVYSWSTNCMEKRWVENYITHNGDFDFYTIRGKTYDLELVQKFLSATTGTQTPAVVDSCAIAGVIDLLRTKGCFGLSARYAVCFGEFVQGGKLDLDEMGHFPKYEEFESLGEIFENALDQLLPGKPDRLDSINKTGIQSLEEIGSSITARTNLAKQVCKDVIESHLVLIRSFAQYIDIAVEINSYHLDEETLYHSDSQIFAFCMMTINAFFDNDLFQSTKLFLKNAKGSFGLSTSSTLDAHRQICFAARGQTVSISFYPDKGLVCFGSEQAATKAGMKSHFRDGENDDFSIKTKNSNYLDDEWVRLDLDDLGGEIIVLDWGKQSEAVSKPNRHLPSYKLMHGKLTAILHQESQSAILDSEIFHRMTQLSGNPLIHPPKDSKDDDVGNSDLILHDIMDIPKVCKSIQDGWHSTNAQTGLNRLTAYSLSLCLRTRLRKRVKGTIPSGAVDILLTGCEVSLWLAEQFASDLQKSFPKLCIQAVSSNKLLGLYGQELAVPAMGFPYSPQTQNLHDTIVIIVSHSGGTFAPLACSNLLQSATKNIFVVTSEWDTQIGKQLRVMADEADDMTHHFQHSRIFSTEIGVRPAEPCSVSVVATHQLLTNLFEYISVVILSDPAFQRISAAVITEQDIKVLARCNHTNVDALTEITAANAQGYALDRVTQTLTRLRAAGDLWAEHVLENARAYIMSFIYVFATVTSGWPLVYGVAYAFGLDMSAGPWAYICRLLDSCIYFWLPQINITFVRLWQGRNLKHRMVGRTVVIGDIPWVAQSAEAFLSKIFAVSYSIAGLNVLSGNPNDHLVHRHTHRVVRGTLALFGRPDGRLSALSTSEASVCLSVNQASSIQSWGGTCESITIGHNPFKLNLSKNGIFLNRHRPLFLCERLLVENDATTEKTKLKKTELVTLVEEPLQWRDSCLSSICNLFRRSSENDDLNNSLHRALDCSISIKRPQRRSAAALLGAYLEIEENNELAGNISPEAIESISLKDEETQAKLTVEDVVSDAISGRKWSSKLRQLFQSMDVDKDGELSIDEFIAGIIKYNPNISKEEAQVMFREADVNGNLSISVDEFLFFIEQSKSEAFLKVPVSHRDSRGIIQIEMSKEKYFGEDMRRLNSANKGKDIDFLLARNQHLSQELYESRIASLQRFVSMVVMFHQMGKRVENFFGNISFGLWSYRMDRTHSIMRIATTASPVSGADVRQRMEHLRLLKRVQRSVDVISTAYLAYKERKNEKKTDAQFA